MKLSTLEGLNKAEQALLVLRVLICGLIAAHGWSRFLSGGYEPFGTWLESQGFPFGFALACIITAIEIIGTPLLAFGIGAFYLCLIYSGIYSVGIILVHAPEGWFVVGAGRNGMEYSVLLISCLACIAYQYLPNRH